MNDELIQYRRRLPHWRLVGSVYFVTWILHKSQSALVPAEKDLIRDSLLHFDKVRYQLSVYVIMDDHVHLLVQPLDEWRLEKNVQGWKRHTSTALSRHFGRTLPVWQDEYMDRIIRNEMEFIEKANYILTNSQRRWPDIKEYRWVGIVE